MGVNLRKAAFETLHKTSENTKQDFPLLSFLGIMTLGCVDVFCPHSSTESLGISYSHRGERGEFSNHQEDSTVLKRAESHRCEVKTLGKRAFDFITFFRFLERNSFKNRLQNQNRLTDFSQKKFEK